MELPASIFQCRFHGHAIALTWSWNIWSV